MNTLSSAPKERLKEYIQKLPYISDFYFYWMFPSVANFYRGKYQTYAEAQNAIPAHIHRDYDLSQAHPTSLENRDVMRPYDYPLLSPLQESLQVDTQVLDLGGGVGIDYYKFRKVLPLPSGLKWLVCDVPAAVKIGQALAQQQQCFELDFTSDFQTADGCDLLLTNGALQYIEPSLADLLNQLTKKPQHILINYVPCYEGNTFFTVQNLWTSRCPYKIQNRQALICDIENIGYQLVDHWQTPRTCTIPFHSACFVKAYHGFYFSLKP